MEKKIKKGDGKTPEGLYFIEKKIQDSSFYKALTNFLPKSMGYKKSFEFKQSSGRANYDTRRT